MEKAFGLEAVLYVKMFFPFWVLCWDDKLERHKTQKVHRFRDFFFVISYSSRA